MTINHPRLIREQKTVDLMIKLYCRDKHGSTGDGLCDSCDQLQQYAQKRLEKCPYQEKKTTCANCLTHCYLKTRREEIRQVMRYAGPRMLKEHPWLAVLHLMDGFRKPQPLKKKVNAK
ncbi:MAG: hypothetical protein CL609_03185 [Anaerolineaceae bacterium]|nr:hypothetical protein [Anaerolineaceae bacterium]